MFNNHTLTIYRLAKPSEESGESYKREYKTTGRTITGHLSTSSPEYAALNDGEFGKMFQISSDDVYADLKIGDELVEGSTIYDVRGVIRNTDGPCRRLEATIVLHIDQ